MKLSWFARFQAPPPPPPPALDKEWLGLAAFTRGEDCLAGNNDVAFYRHMEYDSHKQTLLFAIAIAMCVNIWILYHHWTKPAHPKFQMHPVRHTAFLLHLISGTTEILTGFACWWIPDPAWLVMIMAVASMLHAFSASIMAPLTCGIKVITVPGYYYVILLKALTAVNVFMNPDCGERVLALIAIHTIYAWFRISWMVFINLRIMPEYSYTLALVSSCTAVLPMIEERLWLLLIASMIVYRTILCCMCDESTVILQHKEGTRNFHLERVACPFAYTGAVCPHDDPSKPSSKTPSVRNKKIRSRNVPLRDVVAAVSLPTETSQQSKRSQLILERGTSLRKLIDTSQHDLADSSIEEKCARVVFDAIDVDGSGELSFSELVWTLGSCGVPMADANYIVAKVDQDGSGKVDFDEFKTHMRSLWRWAWVDLCEDRKMEARMNWESDVVMRSLQEAELRFGYHWQKRC